MNDVLALFKLLCPNTNKVVTRRINGHLFSYEIFEQNVDIIDSNDNSDIDNEDCDDKGDDDSICDFNCNDGSVLGDIEYTVDGDIGEKDDDCVDIRVANGGEDLEIFFLLLFFLYLSGNDGDGEDDGDISNDDSGGR